MTTVDNDDGVIDTPLHLPDNKPKPIDPEAVSNTDPVALHPDSMPAIVWRTLMLEP